MSNPISTERGDSYWLPFGVYGPTDQSGKLSLLLSKERDTTIVFFGEEAKCKSGIKLANTFGIYVAMLSVYYALLCLQGFDTVGWAAGRASGL